MITYRIVTATLLACLSLLANAALIGLHLVHRRGHIDTTHLLRGDLNEHLAYVVGRAARSAAKDFLQDLAEERTPPQ